MKIPRNERGLLIADVAEAIGVNPQSLKNAENGTQLPYPKMRKGLSKFYGIPEKDLFEDWDRAHAFLRRLGGER